SYRLRDEGEAVVAEAERASGLCLFMQGTQARPILLDIEVRYLPRDDPQIHDDGADIEELGPAGALRPPSDGETGPGEIDDGLLQVPIVVTVPWRGQGCVEPGQVAAAHLLGEEGSVPGEDAADLRGVIAVVTVDDELEGSVRKRQHVIGDACDLNSKGRETFPGDRDVRRVSLGSGGADRQRGQGRQQLAAACADVEQGSHAADAFPYEIFVAPRRASGDETAVEGAEVPAGEGTGERFVYQRVEVHVTIVTVGGLAAVALIRGCAGFVRGLSGGFGTFGSMSTEKTNKQIIAITRFKASPEDTEEVKIRHAALVSAVRSAAMGLEEARLGRTEVGIWVVVWRWDNAESIRKAQELTQTLPEAKAAFALASDVTGETMELLQES